jgi:hypothetical protein
MSLTTRTPKVFRLLLILTMIVSALVPAALLAASPQQSSDVVGVYESDPIDTGLAGSDGLIVTLSLFEDGTMEAISDFQDGETPIFEQGVWVDEGDGTVTITFAFSDGEPYEPAVDVNFEVDGDALVAADLVDYGDDGLVVFRVDDEPVSAAEEFGFDATADVVADLLPAMDDEMAAEDDDMADEEDAAADVFDIEGVYISNELVDDTGTGAVLVYLSEDGLVETFFNNFDAETAPVGRLGTWEETESGGILLTLDQELMIDGEFVSPEDLEEAESVEFELINGVLVSDDIVLYPVDEIAEFWTYDEEAGDDAMDDADAMTDEEAMAEDDGSYVLFMSPIDSIMAGMTVVLLASEDGPVTISLDNTDADISLVINGMWEELEPGVYTMTFTEDADGNELDEPIVIVFEEDEDSNLVGVDFDTDLFGDELILELTQE